MRRPAFRTASALIVAASVMVLAAGCTGTRAQPAAPAPAATAAAPAPARPPAARPAPTAERAPLVIRIDGKGEASIGGKAMTDAALEEAVADAASQNRRVLIEPQAETQWGDLMKLTALVRKAGGSVGLKF